MVNWGSSWYYSCFGESDRTIRALVDQLPEQNRKSLNAAWRKW